MFSRHLTALLPAFWLAALGLLLAVTRWRAFP